MIPTIGRIVHYKISEGDAQSIGALRGRAASAGNPIAAGDVYPAMIVRAWGKTAESCVQLQVFLDGPDTYWATSRNQGTELGQWSEPARV